MARRISTTWVPHGNAPRAPPSWEDTQPVESATALFPLWPGEPELLQGRKQAKLNLFYCLYQARPVEWVAHGGFGMAVQGIAILAVFSKDAPAARASIRREFVPVRKECKDSGKAVLSVDVFLLRPPKVPDRGRALTVRPLATPSVCTPGGRAAPRHLVASGAWP
jgi:hypothetical protein